MILRNIDLDIDYLEELEEFDVWDKKRIREDKFQACSPFRSERHPSFACNLENGLWIDSGSSDDYLRKGNFVTLLAFLREETAEDVIAYLVDKYSPFNVEVETLELNLDLSLEEEEPKTFNLHEYKKELIPSAYLSSRGVSLKVQEVMNTLTQDKSVGFPWHDVYGNVINIKYRSTTSKYFWYEEGQPIKYHVYGLFLVRKYHKKTVYVVESEVDALYLWSCGFPAIALGRAGMSEAQRILIMESGIETLVIATDNDKAGRRAGLEIIRELAGHMEIHCIELPRNVKDVNDVEASELKTICKKHRPIRFKVL